MGPQAFLSEYWSSSCGSWHGAGPTVHLEIPSLPAQAGNPKAQPSPESTRGSEKETKQNIKIKKETLLPRMAADSRKAEENKMFRLPECFMNL